MKHVTYRFSMAQTNEWLDHLRDTNRKENTIRTHRNNVGRCLLFLWADQRSTDAMDIGVEDVRYLWKVLPVKEDVRLSYLRSLSLMVEFHSGIDVVKRAGILHNRESRERVFIDDESFRKVYEAADELERLVLCLGAYMGLRRGEMQSIRDDDIDRGVLTVHGKGHGEEGLVDYLPIPGPVLKAIEDYRRSEFKRGIRTDDFLLQSRRKDGKLHRMCLSRISELVHELGVDNDVRITTHSLRRYYATTLYYNAECDLQTVKRLMRHADISTTLKCYVNAYDEDAILASEKLVRHIDGVVSGEAFEDCDGEEDCVEE